jgi:hypothetical protein
LSLIHAEMGTCYGCELFRRKYFREKAALCLRLADGLSLNNPGRFQLMDMAEEVQGLSKELEAQAAQQRESGTY